MSEIRWPKNDRVTFHGRNGTGFCTGVEVMEMGTVGSKRIMLEPFTSRDHIGNCSIDIPISALGELISALQAISKRHARASAPIHVHNKDCSHNYTFTLEMGAAGSTPDDAWGYAVEGFVQDPGSTPEDFVYEEV